MKVEIGKLYYVKSCSGGDNPITLRSGYFVAVKDWGWGVEFEYHNETFNVKQTFTAYRNDEENKTNYKSDVIREMTRLEQALYGEV